MAIAFVQAKGVQSSSATSVTTAAMTTTSGNQLVAGIGQFAGTALGATPVSDSKSNTWAQAWKSTALTKFGGCYYAENITGGSGHTVTFTEAGTAVAIALAVVEVSGLALSSTLDKTAHADSNVDPKTSGATATTVFPAEILVGVCAQGSGSQPPISYPGFYTDVIALADSSPEGGIFSYAIVAATGTYSFSWSYSTAASGQETTGVATFKGTGIAFVQGKGVQTSGATSITTASFTSTSGNFIAGTVAVDSVAAFPASGSVTDSKSNTYSNAWRDTTHGGGCVYSANITGGASHTVTFTPNASTFCMLGIGEFSGVDVSTPFDVQAHAATTVDPRVSGTTGTTAQASELIIGSGTQGHLANIPYSITPAITGFIDRISLADGTAEGIVLGTQVVAATAAYTYFARTQIPAVLAEAIGIATFTDGVLPAQTITAPACHADWHAVAPTLTANVTLAAPACHATWIAVAAAVAGGAVTRATPATSATWIAVDPVLNVQTAITAPACVATWTAVAPTLTGSNATLTTPATAATWTIVAPAVAGGAVTRTTPATPATWRAVAPYITNGDVPPGQGVGTTMRTTGVGH